MSFSVRIFRYLFSFFLTFSLFAVSILFTAMQSSPPRLLADIPENAPQVTTRIIIYGQIVNQHDQNKTGWRVQAVRPDGRIADESLTDQAGHYHFRPLSASFYQLRVLNQINQELALAPTSDWEIWPDVAGPAVERNLVVLSDDPLSTISTTAVQIQTTTQITGVVRAADTGLPLRFVHVTAYTLENDYADGSYTNRDGEYTLSRLSTGTYKIRFLHYGSDYLTEWYDNQPDFASATPVTINDGDTITNINANLSLGGKINGQVTAADTGNPLENVSVVAYLPDGCGDFISVASTSTNAAGEYTLRALSAGEYRLHFRPLRDGVSAAYFPGYYDGKSNLEEADAVTVTLANVVDGIDASLTKGGQITGRITAADSGLPLKDVSIYVYNENGTLIGSVWSNETGVYTTMGLRAGRYRLRFRPSISFFGEARAYLSEYYNDKDELATADVIPVSNNLVSGIDAVLARGGQVTGRITAADTSLPLKHVYVTVYDTNNRYISGLTSTDANGEYITIGLDSGNYHLRFSPAGDSVDYVVKYYNDKPNLTVADPINVTAPNLVSGIDAVLARGGKITGVVTTTETGVAVKGATVRAYNAAGLREKSSTTNSNGEYAIAGLASGEYRLYFYYRYPFHFGCSTTYITFAKYYDDKPDLATADALTVTAPDTISGIDETLPIPSRPFDRRIFLPAIKR